jgi:hypothetical protein
MREQRTASARRSVGTTHDDCFGSFAMAKALLMIFMFDDKADGSAKFDEVEVELMWLHNRVWCSICPWMLPEFQSLDVSADFLWFCSRPKKQLPAALTSQCRLN